MALDRTGANRPQLASLKRSLTCLQKSSIGKFEIRTPWGSVSPKVVQNGKVGGVCLDFASIWRLRGSNGVRPNWGKPEVIKHVEKIAHLSSILPD